MDGLVRDMSEHTPAYIINGLARPVVRVNKQYREVCPRASVSRLYELTGGLKENIDCNGMGARFCVSGGKSAGFLMCFVRLACGYKRQNGFESS